jgi:hypothetical protein
VTPDLENPKFQNPNPKEIPMGQKSENPKSTAAFFPFLDLVFGFSLGFGAWDLGFLAHARRSGWMTRIVFALPVP